MGPLNTVTPMFHYVLPGDYGSARLLVTSLPGTVVGQGAEPAGGLLRVCWLRMELEAGELFAWAVEGLGLSCHQLSTGETGLRVERGTSKSMLRVC